MSIPETGDILRFGAYNEESEKAALKVMWNQTMKTREAKYYIVKAKNTSKGNVDVLLYIQDHYYNGSYISRFYGARKDGNDWIVPVSSEFQHGQAKRGGDHRFLVLHDKENKFYQHRILLGSLGKDVAGWAKELVDAFGAAELANSLRTPGAIMGDYLRNF